MNYLDPEKRSILAGEYVLGTLTPAVRANFERAMRFDASLARLVGEWADRFAAIDTTLQPVKPPTRVWRAIAARTTPPTVKRTGALRESLAFWRGLTAVAAGVAAALVLVLVVTTLGPQMPSRVVAVLSDKDGQPAWIVREDKARATLVVDTVHGQTVDAQHAFELWVIADKTPRPLGVIPARIDSHATIPAASVPKDGVAFAVSLEPPGGSPTGLPTGPVLYQGRVLND
ncbi:MAG TPA: anti-sigma factor [Magnetospirillaceae bacterium]|jgi:anti-sigma-K factor RskA